MLLAQSTSQVVVYPDLHRVWQAADCLIGQLHR